MEIPYFIESLRIDHFLIVGIVITAIFRRSKEFIKHWGPFIVLWLVYDMMRGIADNQDYINIENVYNFEMLIFGWMFDDQIPSYWMRDNIKSFTLDAVTALIYTLHIAFPIIVGLLIFYVSKDIETFKYFSHSFLLTTYAALVTFALFPVAPPWYVTGHGFDQPELKTNVAESAAGLVAMDDFFNGNYYGSFYETFNSNPYAAVPSLHSAYSFITAYFFIMKYRHKSKLVYLVLLYPLIVWFSAIYLQHHYIVDLIAGVLYVLISVYVIRFLRKRKFRRLADNTGKDKTSADIDNLTNTGLDIPDT